MRNYYFTKTFNGDVALSISNGVTADLLTEIAKTTSYEHLIVGDGDWEDLLFLKPIASKLTKLTIIGDDELDASLISEMSELKLLKIIGYMKGRWKIKFSNLKKLKHVDIDYFDRKYGEIFQLPQVEELHIKKYDRPDLTELGNMRELRVLNLAQGKLTTLEGIKALEKLEQIELTYLRNLSDVQEMSSLKNLKSFQLAKCPKLNEEILIKQLGNFMRLRAMSFFNTNEEAINIKEGYRNQGLAR